jgi:hypothetical protein
VKRDTSLPRGTKQLIQRSLPEAEVRRQGFPVPYCPVPVLTKWEIRRQHPDRHGGWPSIRLTPREKFAALNAPAVLETLLDLPDQFAEKSTR